jgi:pimeloyl-ACP methyl ester carboxylesterase
MQASAAAGRSAAKSHFAPEQGLEESMSNSENTISRRLVLGGAAAGGLTAAGPPATAAPGSAIWSRDYEARKGAVSLYMYRKSLGPPQQGAKTRPVVFLIHGSSLTARSSYDLKAGGQDFSMMDRLARAGFDVWTMDHEGYGRSSRTSSNSDLASGADDIAAGMTVIRRETGRTKAHLFGESSGALRAGIYASRSPETVDRLVLGAFSYTGKGSPTLIERAKQLEFYRTHNRRPVDRDMYASIFTRDGMAVPKAIVDKLAHDELQFGGTVPTGSYLDMSSKLPVVDPLKIASPLLMIRGEHDGIATVEDVLDFYRRVKGDDKQFAIVPGAHALSIGPGYRQMWHTVIAFLTMPARAAQERAG